MNNIEKIFELKSHLNILRNKYLRYSTGLSCSHPKNIIELNN